MVLFISNITHFQPFKDKVDEKAAKAVNSGEYGRATKVAAETKDFTVSAGGQDVDKKEVRVKMVVLV